MAFSGIVAMLYVIDILYCTVINDNWGIGVVNYKKHNKSTYHCPCYFFCHKATFLRVPITINLHNKYYNIGAYCFQRIYKFFCKCMKNKGLLISEVFNFLGFLPCANGFRKEYNPHN